MAGKTLEDRGDEGEKLREWVKGVQQTDTNIEESMGEKERRDKPVTHVENRVMVTGTACGDAVKYLIGTFLAVHR